MNNQKGAVLPILVVILLLIGIAVGTKLISVPQIFKPKAYENKLNTSTDYSEDLCQSIYKNISDFTPCGGIAGLTCPEGTVCVTPSNIPDAQGICISSKQIPPQTPKISCNSDNKVTLTWQAVKESVNYTIRINKYPEEWAPDYSGFDADRPTEGNGDRALEAGNVTTKTVNVGPGSFAGATVTAQDGSVQKFPSFDCPGKIVRCAQVITYACETANSENCKEFPTPCDVPQGWKILHTR